MIRLYKTVMILPKKLGRWSIWDMIKITKQTDCAEPNTAVAAVRTVTPIDATNIIHFPMADLLHRTLFTFMQQYLNKFIWRAASQNVPRKNLMNVHNFMKHSQFLVIMFSLTFCTKLYLKASSLFCFVFVFFHKLSGRRIV